MFADPSPFSAVPDIVPPRIQLTVKGGELFPGGLAQWMTDLIVQGGMPARCSLLMTRYNGDLIGRPVGLFSMPFQAMRLQRLVDQLMAVEPEKLPKGTSGDASASNLKLTFQNGSRNLTCAWNAADRRYRGAIAPAMDDLTALMTEVLTKPERAITVTAERTEEGGVSRLRLRLTNVGIGEVIVADPRLATPLTPEPRAYVQAAFLPPEVPGQMDLPPDWQRVSLEAAPAGLQDEGVIIPAKGSVTFLTRPWTPPTSGEYVVQAVWQDYYGPIKINPLEVQAPVPQSADTNDKPFVLRGAAFSSFLRFDSARKE